MTAPDGDLIIVGSVGVEVQASARRFARSLKREVEQAFRGAGASLAKSLQNAANKQTIRVKVEPHFDQDALDQAVAAKRAKPVEVPVEADRRSAAAAGVTAAAVATAAAAPVRMRFAADTAAVRRLVGTVGRLALGAVIAPVIVSAVGALGQGIAALLAGLTAALAGLVAPLGNLVSVLVTAAGSLVALPGAIAIGVVALAAFKIGLSGVGEALKSVGADTAEFNEAIKDLAPEAQEFVRAIRDLRPAFQELRMEVQNALFAGFAEQVRELWQVHLPGLRSGLVATASFMNQTLAAALGRLTTEQAKIDLQAIFADAASTVQQLGVALAPLVDILRDVAVVGADVVENLTSGAGDAVGRFSQRIAEMRQSGELRALILDGLDALKLLGSALGDIVGIFGGLFRAAGAVEAGGLFGFLERLNELVNSTSAQQSLGTFFRELGRIGDALMPVLRALGSALAVVSVAIGDIAVETAPHLAQFLLDLGDALAALAPGFIALGPSVVALGKALLPLAMILADLVVEMAPGIEAVLVALGEALQFVAPFAELVGRALGDLLTAAAPLLPLLGILLANLLGKLAPVLSALVTPAGALLEVFADLAAEWATQMLPVLAELAEQLLPVFAQVGQRVLDTFRPLIPVIADLAEQFAGELSAKLPSLVEAFAALVLAVADMNMAVWTALVDAAIQLVPTLPELAEAGVALALALTDMVVALVPLIPPLTDLLVLVLQLVTPSTVAALTVLIDGLTLAVQASTGPLQQSTGMLRGFGTAVDTVRQQASDRLSGLLNMFRNLPGRIKKALGNLSQLLLQAGRDVVNGLKQGIQEKLPNVLDVIEDVGGGLLDGVRQKLGIRSPSKVFADEVGRWIPEGIAEGVRRNRAAPMRAVDDLLARFNGGAFHWDVGETSEPSGGAFTGDLYLDSGEFLGKVHGVVQAGLAEHDRELVASVMQGTGAAQ